MTAAFADVGEEGVSVPMPDGVEYRLTVEIDRPGHRQIRITDNGDVAGFATRAADGEYQVSVGILTHQVVYIGGDADRGVTALHRYLYGPDGIT